MSSTRTRPNKTNILNQRFFGFFLLKKMHRKRKAIGEGKFANYEFPSEKRRNYQRHVVLHSSLFAQGVHMEYFDSSQNTQVK